MHLPESMPIACMTILQPKRVLVIEYVIHKTNWACTCHIHLTGEWVDKLGKIDYNGLETSLMEYEKNYVEGVSRLACQIKLQPEHDGLIVNLLKHELL